MIQAALILTANSIVLALLYGLIAAVLVYLVAAYVFHSVQARAAAAITFVIVALLCLLGGLTA